MVSTAYMDPTSVVLLQKSGFTNTKHFGNHAYFFHNLSISHNHLQVARALKKLEFHGRDELGDCYKKGTTCKAKAIFEHNFPGLSDHNNKSSANKCLPIPHVANNYNVDSFYQRTSDRTTYS